MKQKIANLQSFFTQCYAMPSKHIVFTVINDLTYDQRMQRICGSLANAGYEVTLIGRKLAHSKILKKRNFKQIRLNLFFTKGKLFYLEYNFRLLFYLLFNKFDIYSATDLDTLLPHFFAAKIKRKPHVYDAHEYFPELPEIVNRPFTKWVWTKVEQLVVPRTKYAYTINQSYANIFRAKYNTSFQIIRNASVLKALEVPKTKEKPYILYQGAVNVGRGIEEMIQAMSYINDCYLYICGNGDVYDDCVSLVKQLDLEEKVHFFGFVEPEKLRQFTLNATLGFTFFTKQGISYHLSLANRFFDYFHNGVPQLCVNYPEYKSINEEYEVAVLVNDLKPKNIAEKVNNLLQDKKRYEKLKANCLEARKHINWQEEEKKLIAFYEKIK